MEFSIPRAQVPPDRSWASLADEYGGKAGEPGPVLALDLAGDPLRFRVDPQHRLAVRPMSEGDLPDLTRWVNEPHVARWWDPSTGLRTGEHRTPEQVAAHYGPALRGEDPTRFWIWEVNGRSVGFAQSYRIADHPDWSLLCGRPDAVGYDYAVGEPAFVGRGLGTSLLWVFLRDIVVPAYADAGELFAAPDHRNVASRRVLAKLGAQEGFWFDEPRSDGTVATVVGCSTDVAQVIGAPVVTGE